MRDVNWCSRLLVNNVKCPWIRASRNKPEYAEILKKVQKKEIREINCHKNKLEKMSQFDEGTKKLFSFSKAKKSTFLETFSILKGLKTPCRITRLRKSCPIMFNFSI